MNIKSSVVGLSLDYGIINWTKHSSYLIYNASLYFSSTVQKQYYQKYGFDQMIPVAPNDVAFSSHGLLMTSILLSQIAIYERGSQKFSRVAIGFVAAVWLFAAVCFFIALPTQSWLWLISIFNSIQVCLTFIKYFPQALLNFLRKSTIGFSVEGILLDFSGSVFNYVQMVMQSIDQGSWVNFSGNMGKMLISLVSIFYDSVFMLQHYVLYRDRKDSTSSPSNTIHEHVTEPLLDEHAEKQPKTRTPTQQASLEDV